ncbi:MAG: ABC transporter ATP-binding protein [Pseudomonadales bacterium]|nr:ABC transporter ATP-binding protein [Pseudomonadales bacterium]MCP5344238.1 ABC transporter ATP-binding protein [Pseudomonadales bacterium]
MLEVRNLQAGYGGSQVLQGISFCVNAGEIVSLLGRNGSGRSTLLKALMGELPARGSVLWREQQLVGLPSHRIARLGLGHVPEQRHIFPTLSVGQNLEMGRKPGQNTGRWSQEELLERFPGLAARLDVPGGVLSGGEQQVLSLCRALMGDPELLLVDEPSEGLAPALVEEIAALLQEVARRECAILLVEQRLNFALRICSRLYVMGHGEIVFSGTPESLHQAESLRREWLQV